MKQQLYQSFSNRKIALLSIIILILLSSLYLIYNNVFEFSSYCSTVPLEDLLNYGTEIRTDGVTLVKGKPFFPFGFYHVSWETNTQERKNALNEIANAGFNTIHVSVTRLEDYAEFLNEAEKLGVYVISEQNVGLLNLISAFKHKPAVLGWNIADDVDNGRFLPSKIWKLHQLVRKADHSHITYVSGFSERIKQFANCSDVIGMQSYPIRYGKERELSSTYSQISIARDAISAFNRSFYANLQTFNWSNVKPLEYKGTRTPTFKEVRNMTYQALLAGAKGIIYYTYHDSSWHLPSQSQLWNELKFLAPEIREISSILLEGKFQKVEANSKSIISGIWVDRNEALVVVVNTSYDRAIEIKLELPISANTAQLLFQKNTSIKNIGSNKIHDVLQPLAVYAYKLKA